MVDIFSVHAADSILMIDYNELILIEMQMELIILLESEL